jgi:glycosyltransferase involved in cell wall biosynthesis
MNDADFHEFLAVDGGGVETVKLCAGKAAYLKAVADGTIWSMTTDVLASVAPDVVAIAGWAFPESLAAIAWARRQGVCVIMMSASQQHDGPRVAYREIIKSRIVKSCHAALVGGREQGEYVRRLGMPAERIFYGYDAVDNDHFWHGSERARVNEAQLRRALGLPERYVLASGRFIAKKNLPRLVAAFGHALAQSGAPHHLVILGDGPDRMDIADAIRDAGLEARVHLPGFQSYNRLPAYYGLAEAFVHVSLAEQWGLVINEAAAAGLPLVVSSPCGAAAELVEDGVNGLLVEPTETASISCALTSIMRAKPESLSDMGVRSRQIVARWGLDRFADGLVRAAEAGLALPARKLPTWDGLMLRALSRRTVSAVS